jgi:hypothetical protein
MIRFPQIFVVSLICLIAWKAPEIRAADWTLKGGEKIKGELSSFDFQEKRAIFRGSDGKDHPVPSEDLTADSRWRLLVSPQFARSYPADRWTSEQGRFLFLASIVPSMCLLVSFYACALLLLKSGSIGKALGGWLGSALLGVFLMSFYLFLSGRNPASAKGVLIGGSLISALVLSFFISIVYQTTTLNGLKMLLLHVFGAFLFLLLAVVGFRKATQVFDFESVIEEKIMIPVGLLPKE